MSAAIERDADSWVFTWPEHQVGFGYNRVHANRFGGLDAMLTVESTAPAEHGIILGPVQVNLSSVDSHERLARALSVRRNHCNWAAMLAETCGTVVAQFSKLPPMVNLAIGEDQPVEYLYPGIPTNETSVLYGDGEAGKSLLALTIAIAARSGITLPWSNLVTTEPRTVCVLDWETNERTYRSRYRRLAAGLGLDHLHLPAIHYREMHQPLADALAELRIERSRLGIGLFIIDSLSYACGGSLNDDDTARAGMNAARQLAPATRLGVAHISADAVRSTRKARPFGSAFFWNSMRSGFEIRKAEDSPADMLEMGIYHRKANDGEYVRPFGLEARFDGPLGPIRISRADIGEVPDLASRTPLSTRIRAALRAGALNTKELAETLEVSDATIRTTTGRMPDVVQLEASSGGGITARPAVWGLAVS